MPLYGEIQCVFKIIMFGFSLEELKLLFDTLPYSWIKFSFTINERNLARKYITFDLYRKHKFPSSNAFVTKKVFGATLQFGKIVRLIKYFIKNLIMCNQ